MISYPELTLGVESIKNFPCEELRTLDKLWVDYSKGKFGFSVQKKVWMACGGVPEEYDWDVYERFADQVGWRRRDDWFRCDELTISQDSSKQAHLPYYTYLSTVHHPVGAVSSLFSRSDL